MTHEMKRLREHGGIGERAQKAAVDAALRQQKSFLPSEVAKRLDEAYELDRVRMERRAAARPPPLDLGDE